MGAIADKIKGKLMKAEGRVTGDKVRSAQGSVEDTKGDVKVKASRAKMAVKGKVKEMKARTKAASNRSRTRAATR